MPRWSVTSEHQLVQSIFIKTLKNTILFWLGRAEHLWVTGGITWIPILGYYPKYTASHTHCESNNRLVGHHDWSHSDSQSETQIETEILVSIIYFAYLPPTLIDFHRHKITVSLKHESVSLLTCPGYLNIWYTIINLFTHTHTHTHMHSRAYKHTPSQERDCHTIVIIYIIW